MKHFFLLTGSALFFILGLANCAGTQKQKGENENNSKTEASPTDTTTNAESFNFGLSFNLGQFYAKPDYSTDLGKYSYEELRLLRSVPYARHGHWFKEGEICEKFNAIRQYRLDMLPVVKAHAKKRSDKKVSEYWTLWDKNYPKTYDLIKLSKEEKAFVKKVDAKIAEFEKRRYSKQDGLVLYNPELLVNQSYIENLTPELMAQLTRNDFVISEKQFNQMFNAYELYDEVPKYVTTDLFLHTYHMYFSWLLKRLENHHFLPNIAKMSDNLYKQGLREMEAAKSDNEKELAKFATIYYAIASYLCTENDKNLPEELKAEFKKELANIDAQIDKPSDFLEISDIFLFPYSLFKPRGHYTRDDGAKHYFKAMMWLQSAWFCIDSNKGLQRALYLALQFQKADKKTKDLCHSVYDPLEFLIGTPDNIPVIELSDMLGPDLGIVSVEDIEDTKKLSQARNIILKRFEKYNNIKPKKEELMACKNKVNFMPQRYTPDAEVFSLMYDEKPNSSRPFPNGLDVFDAFGSPSAANVLDSTDPGAKQWPDYGKFRKKVREKFAQFADFDKTMYNKWFESLVTMQKDSKSKPDYMKTSAWQRKDLNASLASWAELKHDAILYAEQPNGAEMGDGGDPITYLPNPLYIQHYVEPNINFWKKTKEMLTLNTQMLQKAGIYHSDKEIKENTEWLQNKVSLYITVSEKEIKDVRLNAEENHELSYTGGDYEFYTLRVLNPEIRYYGWYEMNSPDTCIAQIADVFTRNIPQCEKNGILHAAVAKANEIYVVVERNGLIYITRGAVFDYREFITESGTRLSDEEWQHMLRKDDASNRPSWVKSLFASESVKANKAGGRRTPLGWPDIDEYRPDLGEEVNEWELEQFEKEEDSTYIKWMVDYDEP